MPSSKPLPSASLSRRALLRGTAALGALGASGALPTARAAAPKPGLKPGAVVVFQGDSITDAGRDKSVLEPNDQKALGKGYPAHAAGELIGSYPDHDLKIYNRGISGNKVPDLAARWQEDCLDLKPDILSILVGVNDYWHTIAFGSTYKGTLEDYDRGYRELIARTQEALPDTRIVICEPFTTRDMERFKLGGYIELASKIASDLDLTFVPFQSAFDRVSQKVPGKFWLWDGIHPTPAGHAFMLQVWREAVGI